MTWWLLLLACADPKPADTATAADTDTDADADTDADTDTDTDADTDTDTDTEPPPPVEPCADDPVTSFVTRDGAELVLDGAPFRFISINVPNLHVLEDPYWHLPDPWEQLDAVCAVAQMGGQVTRIYVPSVGVSPSPDLPRHVTAPGVFEEELFVALDEALAVAGRKGVRVIIPLVDQWSWWGGIADYAAFRGLPPEAFWTDEQVVADFLLTVDFLVDRVNTVTGVRYADDPTILAWETGNELDAPTAWTEQVAAHLKALDPNHLVMDGHYGVDPNVLANPDVDIVSNHYYWPPPYGDDYAAAFLADMETVGGQRPFFVGEFGLVSASRVEDLLDAVVAEGALGAMIWSLRFHDVDGGFYWHSEGMVGDVDWQAFHWPGFDVGDAYEERIKLEMLAERGWALQGVSPPPTVLPIAPVILDAPYADAIRWRGSTGASWYTLECAEGAKGPWSVCADGLVDVLTPNQAVAADPTAVAGEARHYRLLAVGSGGVSEPSASVGPVPATTGWSDPLDDLSLAADAANVGIDSANTGYFGGDAGRLFRLDVGDGSAVWPIDGTLLELNATLFHWPGATPGDVSFEVSADGKSWTALTPTETDLGGDWQRLAIHAEPALGAAWLRVTLHDHAGPSWTPQLGSHTVRTTP
jgi:hypothetical protein